MSAEFSTRLQRFAEVIVRVGLNLRAGQRLLLAEPFELQGVSRHAAGLVAAVGIAARAAGAGDVDVIWGDEMRWRDAARRGGDRRFERELERDGERMREHARQGGALLFLQSGHPGLMAGIPAAQVARLREAGWRAYAHVAPDLIAGRTNWTTAPAPTAAWAETVFAHRTSIAAPDPASAPQRPSMTARTQGPALPDDKLPADSLARLWAVVFEACRIDVPDSVAAWTEHVEALERERDELNRRRADAVRFVGEGTDLTIALAPAHVWCTACLRTPDRRRFIANLPTEEIFTAPDRDSASGVVRVARPVAYGGGIIEGATLEFCRGRVVRARAASGEDLLQRLLATDRGATRLGEVALVPRPPSALTRDGACFRQTLLDENALPHIALGESYPFTVSSAGATALNHSLVHVDLPIAAQVEIVPRPG